MIRQAMFELNDLYLPKIMKKATDSLVGSQSFLMLTVVGILKLPFT
jgi:hypothetical protein